jgi:predicted Holliday junction resolvase-like endonuclease
MEIMMMMMMIIIIIIIISPKMCEKRCIKSLAKKIESSGRNIESRILLENIKIRKPGFFSDAAWCILNRKVNSRNNKFWL